MTRKKLYVILSVACIAGYAWLFLLASQIWHGTDACMIKQVAGIPCPSCGATRSVLSLIDGHFFIALQTNPLGLIIAVVLVAVPGWMAYDMISRKDSLLQSYLRFEKIIRRRQFALPAIALVLANWAWNIFKGL